MEPHSLDSAAVDSSAYVDSSATDVSPQHQSRPVCLPLSQVQSNASVEPSTTTNGAACVDFRTSALRRCESPDTLRHLVRAALAQDADFNTLHFGPFDCSTYSLAEADMREQCSIAAEQKAVAMAEKALKGGSSAVDYESIFEDCTREAQEVLMSFVELLKATDKLPVTVTLGSANDQVKTDLLLDTINLVAVQCVLAGISLVNGGANTGWMGYPSKAWHKVLERLKNELPAEQWKPMAKIILVLLRFHGESTEKPCPLGSPGFVTPAMYSFIGRTLLNFALGKQHGPKVCQFYPGGLGTLEEFFRAWAEDKMRGRVEGFWNAGAEPLLYLINAEFPNLAEPYYEPLKRLLNKMAETGAAKASDFEPISFKALTGVEDAHQIARDVVQPYRDAAPEAERAAPSPETPEYKLADRVWSALNKDLEFRRNRCADPDSIYRRLLDVHYRSQVIHEAIAVAQEKYQALQEGAEAGSGRSAMHIHQAVKFAIEKANEWRDQLAHLVQITDGKEIITIIGGEKDCLLDDEPCVGDVGEPTTKLRLTAARIVKRAMQEGTSLVINGSAVEGVSRVISEEWLLCAEEYRQRHGADPESKLIRVQLKLDGETTEPHSLYGSSEILGPPLNSLISKTPLLSLLGTQKHVVVFPGGPAEMEQVATVLLGGQLNGMAHTIYHKDIQPPEVTFLCARVKKTEPFWHPLREQLEAMRKVGALRRKHLKHLNWDYKLAPEALTDSIWS